jgi:hypothetical protein
MRPVLQTILGDRGNCTQAVLASVLELPLESVPNFFDAGPTDTDWWNALYTFLAGRNLSMWHVYYPNHEHALLDLKHRPGHLLVWGESPRSPTRQHYVVWRGGQMVHDPHPGCGGLVRIGGVDLLYPLDPARAI